MGHKRIICIGTKDQYLAAREYIHHKENPDYYRDLESGKRDEEDAYRWYAPDDIFGADWVCIAHDSKKADNGVVIPSRYYDNISKENFLLNANKKWPFWVYDDENVIFDARLIDDESTRDKIDLEYVTGEELMKIINDLPANTLLQLLDSHW